MRFSLVAALAATASASTLRPRDYQTYEYYAVHLDPSQAPSAIASYFGLEFEGPLGALPDHYLLRKPKHDGDIIRDAVSEHKRRVRKRELGYQNALLDGVLFHQKQKLKPPHQKRGPLVPAPRPRQTDEEELKLEQEFEEELEEEIIEELIEEIEEELAEEAAEEAAARPDFNQDLSPKEYNEQVAKFLGIGDPLYGEQWHLFNTIEAGHDLNVTGVWIQGITGRNVTSVIVDDGLDMDSEDLKDNFYAEGSYDFNDHTELPRPRLADDRHGTRCAGEVAAVRNNVCGVGVAYDSKVGGIRILSGPITDADEAIALNYNYERTDLYSCSWGPPDDGRSMGEPGILIKRAMVNAVQNGRGGRGTIYVFATGNGAAADDNCNFDGYVNSIYTVTVGAVDRKGNHPYYSEKCSAQLVVTYSSGSGDAIHTTDVGANNCYAGHGGTSAAAPLAVGVYALVLEVRPDLTWRDIQWLTVLHAVPLEADSDWQATTIGKRFSHQFGYGKIDAWALVEAAKTFQNVKPQAWFSSPWQHVRHEIPQGDRGVASTFTVTEEALQNANLERLEHVTVTTNIDHTRRGDLSLELRSPSGIVSHLSVPRLPDEAREGYVDWSFMSVAHWGESGLGEWTLVAKDTVENEHNGTFVDWKLNLYGESRDGEIQGLMPLPNENDDDDHDREEGNAATISVEIPQATEVPGNPDDHIDRPVNVKPTGTVDQVPPPTDIPQITQTATPDQPSNDDYYDGGNGDKQHEEFEGVTDDDDGKYSGDGYDDDTTFDEDDPAAMPTATPAPSSGSDSSSYLGDWLLPSFLPTFGVSKSTQIWIYGSAILMFVFCSGIAVYLLTARRRRQRAVARESYEFEMLEGDEDDDGRDGGKKVGKKSKRRAGELYDAFAGESDDDVFSEDDEDRYRDEDGHANGHSNGHVNEKDKKGP